MKKLNKKAKITTVCIVFLLITSSIAVSAATSIDFEEYDVGTTAPGDWSAGTVSSLSHAENRSLEVSGSSGTGNSNIENVNINSVDSTILWRKSGSFDTARFFWRNSSTSGRFLLHYHQGDWVVRIYDKNGNEVANILEFGSNTEDWHYSKLVANSSYGTDTQTEFELYLWNANNAQPSSPTATVVAEIEWDIDHITFHNDQTDYYANLDSVYIESSDVSELSGTVTNESNEGIQDVEIRAEDSDGNIVETTTTDSNGSYSMQLNHGNYTITADGTAIGYTQESKNITFESTSTLDFQLEELPDELVVELQKWMYPNTTQTYKGIYLPESGYQIVTSELNVTSSNSSVVAVNNSSNELIAQPGVNNTANVTFQYKHFEVTKEIAVAHRTLEYIHLLPSTQWLNAVLGVDDSGTEYGMGSEIQWIFVAIILASLLAAIGSNEWIGLGTIIITMSLFWILEYISLGMVLASLFFGLFLAFTLLEIPKGNTTEVTVDENSVK